jgi:cytochrome c biogenesis protein CcmG/thiol:disulfide interchange protein DsbE
MRLSDVIGILGALAVGGLLLVLLLTSAVGPAPVFSTPSPPTIPPLPTEVAVASPSPTPTATETPPVSGSPEVGVAIGQRAPALEVTLTDGSVMNTTDFAGQPLWINFMATWCPQCIDELPMMEQYHADLGDQLTMLVVDVGEDRRTVNSFMKSLSFDLPVGVDQDSTVQAAWGAFALPIHFFIDSNGIVQQVVYGGAPPEVFDQAVGDILPEAPASPGS